MVSVSSFISPSPERYSFRTFQELPDIVRQGIVWGERSPDPVMTHHIAQWIIDRYDMNQPLGIGELVTAMESFLRSSVHRRMVTCFVDHRCNMVAAKLAWHEDY